MTELGEKLPLSEIRAPALLQIGTRYSTDALLVGRNPLSSDIALPGDLSKNCLIAKLGDCTRFDTSRAQLRIQKASDGFFVENLSSLIPLEVKRAGRQFSISPGARVPLGSRPVYLQGLEISWGKPEINHCLRVEGMGDSTKGEWYLAFRYETRSKYSLPRR